MLFLELLHVAEVFQELLSLFIPRISRAFPLENTSHSHNVPEVSRCATNLYRSSIAATIPVRRTFLALNRQANVEGSLSDRSLRRSSDCVRYAEFPESGGTVLIFRSHVSTLRMNGKRGRRQRRMKDIGHDVDGHM